jgi:predicted SprT family Zn-dependent metalloprotease
MKPSSSCDLFLSPASLTRLLSREELQHLWHTMNTRYFRERLPAIDIVWSRRLTASAGMFVSRIGPRSRREAMTHRASGRSIRLSVPLLNEQSHDELVNTLAHEMIHQWQFDVLKRRPNHGQDFSRKMREMNQSGLTITIHHSLDHVVRQLAKYAWRCLRCGRAYERQRRTIRPGHHQCGECRGDLEQIRPTCRQRRSNPRLPRRHSPQLPLF